MQYSRPAGTLDQHDVFSDPVTSATASGNDSDIFGDLHMQ